MLNKNTEKPCDFVNAQRLLESANDSARHFRTVYVTYLTVMIYTFVFILSTDQELLFKAGDKHLPQVNMNIPIKEFFTYMPWILLVIHFHLLIQASFLVGKVQDYVAKIKDELEPQEEIDKAHRLLFPASLAHTFRAGKLQWILYLIIFLVIFPLGTLIFTQIRFLPYQSEGITLLHRIIIIIDIVLLWYFWYYIYISKNKNLRKEKLYKRFIWAFVYGLIIVLITLPIVVFVRVLDFPGKNPIPFENPNLSKFYNLISEIKPNYNRFNLPNSTLVKREPSSKILAAYYIREGKLLTKHDESVWCELTEPLNLSNRNLRDAKLSKAKICSADLTRADLTRADLKETILTGANLTETILTGTILGKANLRGTNLRQANLTKKYLAEVDLTKADLTKADLTSVFLWKANLTGTVFTNASLTNADLTRAVLTEAVLIDANLSDVVLTDASLTNANLTKAILTNANLSDANLTKAVLTEAVLIDANLSDANLTKAVLTETDFTGTTLKKANLTEATLSSTDFTGAILTEADLTLAGFIEVSWWLYLMGSNFTRADLTEASLIGTDLRGADLTGADLRWADLTGTDLRWANLMGTDLRGTDLFGINLSNTNFTSATITNTTIKYSWIWKDPDTENIRYLPLGIPKGWKNMLKPDYLCPKRFDIDDYVDFFKYVNKKRKLRDELSGLEIYTALDKLKSELRGEVAGVIKEKCELYKPEAP